MSRKKQEISGWLEAHRHELASGALVVFFQDECHLLWGDLCGYVWGKTKARIQVPIVNERERQTTYYGAVNLYTQQCLIQAAQAGNSEGTIAFLKYLLDQFPESRIALIWDGATYHRSQEVKPLLILLFQSAEETIAVLSDLTNVLHRNEAYLSSGCKSYLRPVSGNVRLFHHSACFYHGVGPSNCVTLG